MSTATTPRPSLVEALPGDHAGDLEPVDQPGHAGSGQQHGVGELGHPQPPVGRLGQLNQHVVAAEGQRVLGDELGLEHAHQRRVGPQERAPRVHLARAVNRRVTAGSGTVPPRSRCYVMRVHGRTTGGCGHRTSPEMGAT